MNLMDKRIRTIGEVLILFTLFLLIMFRQAQFIKKFQAPVQSEEIVQVKTTITSDTNKYVLMLNWKEYHKEKQKWVIQNQYRGDLQGYGKEPFKGKRKL